MGNAIVGEASVNYVVDITAPMYSIYSGDHNSGDIIREEDQILFPFTFSELVLNFS